jgi:transposase InsO family protein
VVKQVIADHGYSERRACRLIGVDRTAFQYRPRRLEDADVRSRLRELANERRRFGYRRLAVMLKRDGLRLNLKKVYRLYKEERLGVRKRGGRKRALGTRAPMAIPQGVNQRWSIDFVQDALDDADRCQRFLLLAREIVPIPHAILRPAEGAGGKIGPPRVASGGLLSRTTYA